MQPILTQEVSRPNRESFHNVDHREVIGRSQRCHWQSSPDLSPYCWYGQVRHVRADAATRDLASTLDEYLSSRVPYGFNGAVLVAHKGRIVLRGGYGKVDPESGAPITAETVFDIGSITKAGPARTSPGRS